MRIPSIVFCAAILAACESTFERRLADYRAYVAECARNNEFAPDLERDENAISPLEKRWRQCSYVGVHRTLLPDAPNKFVYYDLMKADQELTRMVEAGEKTRSERDGFLRRHWSTIRKIEAGEPVRYAGIPNLRDLGPEDTRAEEEFEAPDLSGLDSQEDPDTGEDLVEDARKSF